MKKRLISLALALVMLCTLLPQAAVSVFATPTLGDFGVSGNNLHWAVSGTQLDITGEGEMEDFASADAAPWYAYRDKIRLIKVGDQVENIGDYAFKEYPALVEVDLGAGIVRIGVEAFAGCTQLCHVCYPGFRLDWEGITIGAGNDRLDVLSYPDAVESKQPFLHLRCITLHSPGHVVDEAGVPYDPSCDEDGGTRYTCNCGHTWNEPDEGTALGHDFTGAEWYVLPGEEATCTEQGIHRMDCQREGCTHSIKDYYGPTGHAYVVQPYQWSDDNMTVLATAICDNDETHVITEYGTVEFLYVPPTCISNGMNTWKATFTNPLFDTQTKEIVLDDDANQKLGHDWSDWAVVVYPTCTEDGLERRECNRCSSYQTRVKPSEGHQFYPVEELEPTCTEQGGKRKICATCGHVEWLEVIPAMGHNFNILCGESLATCTQEGLALYACSNPNCEATEKRMEGPLGHDFKLTAVLDSPSCTAEGHTLYECTRCGYAYTKILEPLGHDWSGWSYTSLPTCTEPGRRVHTCNRCQLTVPEPIAAHGHSFVNGVCKLCNTVATPEMLAQLGITNPFQDVEVGTFYFDAVVWAYSRSITTGVTEEYYYPVDGCTRGQVVTFLWRAFGCEEPGSEMIFTDVGETEYYYKPVLWAIEKGITNGMTQTEFIPDYYCTRGQVVTFLYRADGHPLKRSNELPSVPATPTAPNASGFVDVFPENYFYDAVIWAVQNKLTNGMDETHFGPDLGCTRGHIVTFLYRFLDKD